MTMPPTRFPTQNHHAVVVWTPDLAPAESGRLPEALAACRRALELETTLPVPFRNATPAVLERATAHLRSRRLLTEDSRVALALCCEAAEVWIEEHDADSALEAFAGEPLEIVALAARVNDLLTAEAEVARRRHQLADDRV